jgi:2-polyprenyl-3-methyl-5-hydroxy-6-metoxy-1,4-benzoquinol methylase
MNDQVRLDDYIGWDVLNWSASLGYWVGHSTQDLSRCSVLELGSGGGGVSLWMALRGAEVTCSDVRGPRAEAVSKHWDFGVNHRISYEALDATAIPYVEKFDVVVFKSVLGTIATKELQAKAVSQMHKALKKGGELFFAENLTASPVHKFFRRRFVEWGDRWRYVSLAEIQEFLAPFSSVDVRACGVAGTFGRSEHRE